MATDRQTPCLYYVCAGLCEKGRKADYSHYCQPGSKYKPRCRMRYKNHERKKDVYLLYAHLIGESGFHKIWNGSTWKTIMPEVYTKENKDFHAHNTSNVGSKNGRSKLTEEDVKNIRLRKKNGEQLSSVYNDYSDKLTYKSFENVFLFLLHD